MSQDDVGKPSRAQACRHKLQELNHYVQLTVVPRGSFPSVQAYIEAEAAAGKQAFKVVVVSEQIADKDELEQLDQYCRTSGVQFVEASVSGCTARVLTDFGDAFKVHDPSSEEIHDVLIQSICSQENGRALIKLIEGQHHQLQDGDLIALTEVKGMTLVSSQIDSSAAGSVNGELTKVLNVVSRSSFEVELDLTRYTEYLSGGLARHVKVPVVQQGQPIAAYHAAYEELLQQVQTEPALSVDRIEQAQSASHLFDDNLILADFEKTTEVRLFEFLSYVRAYHGEVRLRQCVDLLLQGCSDAEERAAMFALLDKIYL